MPLTSLARAVYVTRWPACNRAGQRKGSVLQFGHAARWDRVHSELPQRRRGAFTLAVANVIQSVPNSRRAGHFMERQGQCVFLGLVK